MVTTEDSPRLVICAPNEFGSVIILALVSELDAPSHMRPPKAAEKARKKFTIFSHLSVAFAPLKQSWVCAGVLL